jgi:hypothetical protein
VHYIVKGTNGNKLLFVKQKRCSAIPIIGENTEVMYSFVLTKKNRQSRRAHSFRNFSSQTIAKLEMFLKDQFITQQTIIYQL